MGQITIDTKHIMEVVVIIFAIIGVAAIMGMGISGISNHYATIVVPVQPQVQVTSTPIPVPNYPSVLTFTVLSTTTSNGHYQVTTTAGNILYFSDYTTWQSMILRATYTGTLVGTDGSAYLIGSAVLISYPMDGYYCNPYSQYCNGYYDNNGYYGTYPYHSSYNDNNEYYSPYPTYYHYGTGYYQCDKTSCSPVAYKQVSGEIVYNGKPPHPIHY